MIGARNNPGLKCALLILCVTGKSLFDPVDYPGNDNLVSSTDTNLVLHQDEKMAAMIYRKTANRPAI